MRFKATFRESKQSFTVSNFGEVQKVTKFEGELYVGDYIVTPKVDTQTMATKDKVMTDDVTIKSIPFFNVSNTSGGSTVYIGNEV